MNYCPRDRIRDLSHEADLTQCGELVGQSPQAVASVTTMEPEILERSQTGSQKGEVTVVEDKDKLGPVGTN